MPNNMDIDELKKAFETFDKPPAFCPDGQCETDEEVDLQDYPSYTEALYAKLVAPAASGIYLSRWDIKDIALVAGDSMAIHPRKRMFELLMKYATSKENMQAVLNSLEAHMEDKVNIYNEFIRNYPNTEEIFQPKIDKAQKTMKLFPKIIEEYFE
jgi:hypothetical protein